jgi:hypothetical protein
MSVVMSDNVSIDPDPTLSAIRSILDAPASFNAAPNLQDQTQKAIAASLHAETARKVKDQKAAMVLDEEKIQPQKKIASPSDSELIKAKPNKQSLFGKLRLQFQPRRKHVVWAGFACAIVLRPNWFLLTFMLPIIVFLGAFAVFCETNHGVASCGFSACLWGVHHNAQTVLQDEWTKSRCFGMVSWIGSPKVWLTAYICQISNRF